MGHAQEGALSGRSSEQCSLREVSAARTRLPACLTSHSCSYAPLMGMLAGILQARSRRLHPRNTDRPPAEQRPYRTPPSHCSPRAPFISPAGQGCGRAEWLGSRGSSAWQGASEVQPSTPLMSSALQSYPIHLLHGRQARLPNCAESSRLPQLPHDEYTLPLPWVPAIPPPGVQVAYTGHESLKRRA